MRKRFASILGIAVLVMLTIVVLPARPAAACSCAPGTDEEHLAHADAVFTTRYIDREEPEAEADRSPSAGLVTLHFEVDAVYKGDIAADQTARTSPDDGTCGLALAGEGPFLVFAYERPGDTNAPDGTLYASLCDGSRALSEGPVPASFGAARVPSAASVDPLPTGPISIDDAPEDTTPYVIGMAVAAAAAVVVAAGAIVVYVRRRTRRVAA